MTHRVLQLISDYLLSVEDAIKELQDYVGANALRSGFPSGGFSRHGTLPSGATYQFHGVGCCVTRNDIDTDFDFGSGGRFDGFDAWRLFRFADQRRTAYGDLANLGKVEVALLEVQANHIIEKSSDGTDHLLYLVGRPARYI